LLIIPSIIISNTAVLNIEKEVLTILIIFNFKLFILNSNFKPFIMSSFLSSVLNSSALNALKEFISSQFITKPFIDITSPFSHLVSSPLKVKKIKREKKIKKKKKRIPGFI